MVKIEETEQTTLVKFTKLAGDSNINSVNVSNTTITRKLKNFTTLVGSSFWSGESGSPTVGWVGEPD